MTVLIAWLAAGLVAAVLAAALVFELLGHARRLTAAVAQVNRDLVPPVRDLLRRLPAPDAVRAAWVGPAGPAADLGAGPEGRPGTGAEASTAPRAGPEAGPGRGEGAAGDGGLTAGPQAAGDSLAPRGRHRARR